MLKTHKTTTY